MNSCFPKIFRSPGRNSFLESFKVVSLFSYQGAFFFFRCRSSRQLCYFIISSRLCQVLFSIFSNLFQFFSLPVRSNFLSLPQSFLFVNYFFDFFKSFFAVVTVVRDSFCIISSNNHFVNNFFHFFQKIFFTVSCRNSSSRLDSYRALKTGLSPIIVISCFPISVLLNIVIIRKATHTMMSP